MVYFLYSKKMSIVPTYILFRIDYKSHNFAELCDFLRFPAICNCHRSLLLQFIGDIVNHFKIA